MKHRYHKAGSVFLAACMFHFAAFTQINPQQVQQFIATKNYDGHAGIPGFYSRLNYQTAWIQKENTGNLEIFLHMLSLSPVFALRAGDYRAEEISAIRNGKLVLQNTGDSLDAEMNITSAAIRFYEDLAHGNTKPALGYNGLNYSPGCRNIPELLADHIYGGRLALLFLEVSPVFPEITAIENKIKSLLIVMAGPGFYEPAVTSAAVDTANKPLMARLYQLGIIGAADRYLPDSTLKEKIKEVQKQFDLVPDGVPGKMTRVQLNIPLSVRMQQLNLAVNYYRWLYCLVQQQAVIVVNLPAANLKVYQNRDVILRMRMIVGKRSTPTPTLAARISEVILYPYWHVPKSIATKELLPAIKRNPGYIDAGNYQVLNKAGNIVDPYSVNWHELNQTNFPYLIRQSTGCDNALGLLKLNFYNPYGVYLHDTPNKNLFKQQKRFYSHGCMRMEKPMDMGHLVLGHNRVAIDTLDQKGCLRNQSPVTVKANERMPVIVWYNPVGIDSANRVIFYEDVYGKFNWK